MPFELQKDENGNVILNPVMGWTLGPVAGMYVLAAIQYATNPQELETEGRVLQLSLMPAQALELAEMLTIQAQRLLEISDDSSLM
jgi:hypothetical protein